VCTHEDAKRCKTIFIEEEFLATVISEEQAQLLIPSMSQPTSLPHFRKLIGYLSSINSRTSIDCTNGASRYIANSLDICLRDAENDLIDIALSTPQHRSLQRQAKLICQCKYNVNLTNDRYHQKGVRRFCKTCALIQSLDTNRHLTTCPGCSINPLPDMTATICTSCQLANKMNINIFLPRWHRYVEEATNTNKDNEDDTIVKITLIPQLDQGNEEVIRVVLLTFDLKR
jgi:hypothetical protein